MPGKLTPRRLSIHDARIAGLYDLEHTIGKGHFAVVKLARHVFTGEKVAVKVIDKTKLDPVSQSHMMQEVRCMKLVQHPNIVRLYEVIDTSARLFLILELGDYDLHDLITKYENKGIKEVEAQQYFSQIIKAIDYCHTLHVVHRDLKPENVVFFEKLSMVKLTDFGFSNLFTPGQQLQTACGSLAYSAPEILLGDAYDAPAVDVWSLGVILYMLVCGRLPFQETNESETLTKILDCRFTVPDHVSSSCKQLIGKMLIREPSKRMILPEIVQFPWVLSGDRGHAEVLPLIAKDQLPVSAHSTIIDQMVAGGIAPEDQIINAIDNDDYSYITATYYLLAERVLASYREEQATRLLLNANKDEEQLSECGESGSGSATGAGTPNHHHSRSRSNSWRGNTSRRACTILKEESEEELSTYLKSSSRQSSRFYKDTLPPIPPLRREHSQHSSSRPSLVTSRASSCESFTPILEEDDLTPGLMADAVAKLEFELNPSKSRKTSLNHPPSEMSPIRELGELPFVRFGLEDLPRPTSISFNKRNTFRSSISIDIAEVELEMDTPTAVEKACAADEKEDVEADAMKMARTPSAPPSCYPLLARKRLFRPPLFRRNSSPSISMFTAGSLLNSSRDRISPQAIQELLEFSRLSGGMKRAASPESRISSRSPSPTSLSGRTSPAISSSFMRLKVSVPSSSGGMRKLSSSPHLLGICEETEDMGPDAAPSFTTQRSVSTIPSQKNPHIGRGNRSASIGFGGTVAVAKPHIGTNKDESYSSVKVIRPRQAVVSPDMVRRYDQHQRFVARSRRSTSASSSETSDDDTNERRLNMIGSKYCKRNPDDKHDDEGSSNGGGGGHGHHGTHRSNSMKEQTIIEEPASNEKPTSNHTGNTRAATEHNSRGYLTPDSPCSSRSLYSESECSIFSRQTSTPLQPILEQEFSNKKCLFNRSNTAKEALYGWLQESFNFTSEKPAEEPESPSRTRIFDVDFMSSCEAVFYRPLRRSRSLDLNAIEISFTDIESDACEFIISESEGTTDSGCSSDDELGLLRKKYLFKKIGDLDDRISTFKTEAVV